MRYSFVIILLLLLFSSCKHNRLNINVSGIQADIRINRFDKMLFEKDSLVFYQNLDSIRKFHRDFFDIYTNYVLQIGTVDSAGFEKYLHFFVTDTVISRVEDSVQVVFQDLNAIKKQLENGFKHYLYYFPEAQIPKIYTCITGFNQSVFTGSDCVGIGLDKYLGRNCVFYDYLGVPKYKMANMYPEKIVPDVFYAWAMTEFSEKDSLQNLLSEMIFQGKTLYFAEAMCPGLPDSVIMGYTSKQIKWCKENESKMWTFLVEKKLIYDTEILTIQKYTGDAPFTNTFSNDSPGRTGCWIGWKIIQSFMNKNKDVTLKELMFMNNSQQILSRSGYFPD